MKADDADSDEWNEESGQAPGSPNSDHNSLSSGDTARAAPDSSPGGDDGGQRRPKRCKISREQLNILIKSFDDEPLPNFDQRQALAKVLGMTPRSVQIWFQNRRQRLKPMQPKSAGACDVPSSSQLLYVRRTLSQGELSQQSFGMPGLAAVAGLCNGYSSDLMSKAMAQLPMGQGSGGGLGSFVHSMNGLPYDVMEPFAATKALLGAGYQPPASLSLSSRLSQQTAGCASFCGAASSSAMHRGVSPAGAGMGAGGSGWEQQHAPAPGPSNAASAAQQKPPQADGLLLLLACAGDSNATGQPAAVAAEAPVYDRSAVAA